MRRRAEKGEGWRTPALGAADAERLGLALRGGFIHHLAVKKVDGSVRKLAVTRIVGDHANGRTFSVQFTQQVHNGLAVL